MTVQDLIEHLQKLPLHNEVMVRRPSTIFYGYLSSPIVSVSEDIELQKVIIEIGASPIN